MVPNSISFPAGYASTRTLGAHVKLLDSRVSADRERGACHDHNSRKLPLCGGVKFEITGPLLNPLNSIALRAGSKTDLVKYYEAPGGYLEGFFRECGSPILNRTAPNSKELAYEPVVPLILVGMG